jgi:hypothetical protein
MTIYKDLIDQDFDPEYDKVLQRGDHGPEVAALQNQLKSLGAAIIADGKFGRNTRYAVLAFQRQHDLVVDGIVGPKTYAVMDGVPTVTRRNLRQVDLEEAADELDVPLPAVMAVNAVESRGSGFFANDQPAILFERHIMYRRLGEHGIDARVYRKEMPSLVNTVTGGYQGGISEHARLGRAKLIHTEAALESASWGAFQIMGYHWQRLGYDSVHEFVAGMYDHEKYHLTAFVQFVKADGTLWTALREQDWATFARRYNGPAYRKNQYDVKMANAFKRFTEDTIA